MNQTEKELQLWEYIDGNCDDATRQEVEQLITADMQYKELYEQLLALHKSVAANIDTEQPHMRFTKNVMEAIAGTASVTVTKKYINLFVVRLIAGFFLVSLLITVLYAIIIAEPAAETFQVSIPKVDTSVFSTGSVLNVLTWVNILTGLLLLDSFLRRKKAAAN